MWWVASPELVETVWRRRQQLALRLGMGAGVTLGMAPALGWALCLAWLGAWCATQALEFVVAGRAERRLREGQPSSAAPLLALLFVNNLLFASMGVLGVRTGDPWTMIGSAWILTGALLNAAATSRASQSAFLASAAPAAGLVLALPIWAGIPAPRAEQMLGVVTGAGLLLVATHVLRSVGLKAIAEARAASSAKSAFIASVGHEIRTPLNGMLGMAQVMAADELSATQRGRVEVIRRSGDVLLSLLNDLLDLSKVEAGKLQLEDGLINMEEVAGDLQQSFQALAVSKDLVVSVTVAPSARGWWQGDPMRFRQILSNLLSNAVKFTSRGSVEAEVSYQAPWLQVIVSDTGPGMDQETVSRLFQKFVQADVSTTRKFGGTGLGLAICRELAELMGGVIEVESTPGVGSRFRVRVPLTQASPPAATSPAEMGMLLPREDPRILVAEDHETNRAVIKLFLEHVGLEAHFVADGEQAVDAAEAGGWDVILMDVQMPVMDGLEAVRLIREREARQGAARVPVIALTANVLPHHVEEYLSSGMDGFVPKPLELQALVTALGEALEPPRSQAAPERGEDLAPRKPRAGRRTA